MTRLLREVRRFAATRPTPGVVAVSGGADSVALLHALHASHAGPLVVAHLNHQLRGADSESDVTFVRELCATLSVECRVKSVDVIAEAAGDNLESAARRIRYAFFAKVASEVSAAWIATAHTADDQAETILHRLIRGTGLQGLRGIAHSKWALGTGHWAEENSTPSAHLLRPLLAVTRADVLAYLASVNQPYREDASNADTRFTRNRIRHELLPLLKTFNPDVVSSLTHVAEHASEAHEVIVSVAGELLAKAERPRAANTIVLDPGALRAAPRAVLRATLRLLWEREGWPLADMSFDSWDRAVEVAGGNAVACDFPGGVTMRNAGRVVQITRRE